MRLLIVGGSVFLGRALTSSAMADGHQVTLLNRGKSADSVPSGVEHLRADRDESLDVLRGRQWDAIIDTCAYFPRQVRRLLAALSGEEHYTFISSVSAYDHLDESGLDENARLSKAMGDEASEVTKETYGPLKSGCEQVVTKSDFSALIIRPGVIAGPFDPTGRFGYWVRRMSADGPFIAPGDGNAPLQIIDVRDLASWIVNLVEKRTHGIFNAVGPVLPITFRDFIEQGVRELGQCAQPKWISGQALAEQQIAGWGKLPLWLPKTHPEAAGLFEIDGRKAWAAGLVNRPLTETIRDVSDYEATLETAVAVGMTREEENALLGH